VCTRYFPDSIAPREAHSLITAHDPALSPLALLKAFCKLSALTLCEVVHDAVAMGRQPLPSPSCTPECVPRSTSHKANALTFCDQIGAPAEEDIKNWGQHSAVATVPDPVMHKAAGEEVSFVFTCQVEGMKVVEPTGPVTPHNRRGGVMPLPGTGLAVHPRKGGGSGAALLGVGRVTVQTAVRRTASVCLLHRMDGPEKHNHCLLCLPHTHLSALLLPGGTCCAPPVGSC
jgi:hypothetical protein